MAQVSEHQVEPVPVEAVRPLRMQILRPGMGASAAVYPGDDGPATVHYAIRDDSGAIIGILTSLPEDRQAGRTPLRTPGHRIRGVAVADSHRRRGIARALVERGLADAASSSALELWANVRESAVPFARAMGLVEVSEPFDMPGLGPHVVMARALKP